MFVGMRKIRLPAISRSGEVLDVDMETEGKGSESL